MHKRSCFHICDQGDSTPSRHVISVVRVSLLTSLCVQGYEVMIGVSDEGMERCKKERTLFRSDYRKDDELVDSETDVEGENAI